MSAVGFHTASPEALGIDSKPLERHRQRIKDHQERGVFPGFAEGVIADGKSIFLNLRGFTDKNKKHKMSERTLFRGYSMMKPITATAFMSLVDDGMFKLDDPVEKYIPAFKMLRVKRGKGTEPMRETMTLRISFCLTRTESSHRLRLCGQSCTLAALHVHHWIFSKRCIICLPWLACAQNSELAPCVP
ncbi:unnamed protein product [Durusdinium trenchii]|uniref:Beta-lactamase-related domain-containing protein n=1 Tax=Durusdinium trenchii TaxID=1381693 RepID=A0ABP0QDT7_9DINO